MSERDESFFSKGKGIEVGTFFIQKNEWEMKTWK